MEKVYLIVVLIVFSLPFALRANEDSLRGRVPSLPQGLSYQDVIVDLGCVLEAKIDADGQFAFPPSKQLSSILNRKRPLSIDVMSSDSTKVYLSTLLVPGQRIVTIDGMSTALSRTCAPMVSQNPMDGFWGKAAALPEMKAFASFIARTGASSGDEYSKLFTNAAKAAVALQSAPVKIPQASVALPDPFPTVKPSSSLFRNLWPRKSQEEKERFLADVRTTPGLSKNDPPHIMAASWFRLSFALAQQYSDLGFLFTKRLKEQIVAGPDAKLAQSLWNLYKFYYHSGIKMGFGDEKTFATISRRFEGNITHQPELRILANKPMEIRWQFEDGAWRLDDISFTPRK